MKPTIYNNKPSEYGLSAAYYYLVDRPLDGMLTNSFFSAFNDFPFFHNNFRQMPDGYKLEVAVPGMSRKDLKLEVDNRVLTVQGQKQQKAKSAWFNWFKNKTEFRSTEICETFVLPEDADITGIRAKCKDGLLKISIPKVKRERTYINIPVEAAAEPEKMH